MAFQSASRMLIIKIIILLIMIPIIIYALLCFDIVYIDFCMRLNYIASQRSHFARPHMQVELEKTALNERSNRLFEMKLTVQAKSNERSIIDELSLSVNDSEFPCRGLDVVAFPNVHMRPSATATRTWCSRRHARNTTLHGPPTMSVAQFKLFVVVGGRLADNDLSCPEPIDIRQQDPSASWPRLLRYEMMRI